MDKRMKNLVIGLGAFTVISFGFGKFFDSRCESTCIGEAIAANTENGLKGLEKFNIFIDDDDSNFVINSNGKDGIRIVTNDSGNIGGDENNPARIKEPLSESFKGKDLKEISIKSFVTDWKITESSDDQVRFVFKGYLPPKEWTVKESASGLELEVTKKGPLEGELQLPKNFAGDLELANVAGDIEVEKLALTQSLEIANVSGDLNLKAAPTRSLSLNTVSGDVTFEVASPHKDLAIDFNSVSGDLKAGLKTGIRKFVANSVSGNVDFKAAKTVGFNFEMEGISASFEGLPKTTKHTDGFGNRSATGSFGSDPKGELSFNSVSGDFKLDQVD